MTNSSTPYQPPRYQPPWFAGNGHLQAALSSSTLRRQKLWKRVSPWFDYTSDWTLDAGNGVRLTGCLTPNPGANSNTLVIVFHGWEGSVNSNYVISTSACLLEAGFDVFRLNFRDHGDSYGLNRGIFNSSLIEEVRTAVAKIQTGTEYTHYALMGFSLGANFALRVGLGAELLPKALLGIYAVCPVLDPAHTTAVLEKAPFWYEGYFVRKWKRSLAIKAELYQEYNYQRPLKKMRRLRQMNDFFIPRYTPFKSVADYFQSYTLTGQKLSLLRTPTQILAAGDDPVIPVSDFSKIARPQSLQVNLQPHGSHCAFLQSLSGSSWADEQARDYFLALGKNAQS